MRTENEIKKQLEEVYEHRLQLRFERKTKRLCRNCKNGVPKEFDLGEFGTITKWECRNGESCNANCCFDCRYDSKSIEDEMLMDISDSSVCGAKEPKIATLLWVLHDNAGNGGLNDESEKKQSFISKIIKKVFN